MKISISIFILCILSGQQDSTVKYFSTNFMRTNILKGKPEKNVYKKEAHFRAVYYPSGELKALNFYLQIGTKGNERNQTLSMN